jgi:hypothetical protein
MVFRASEPERADEGLYMGRCPPLEFALHEDELLELIPERL